MNKLKLALIIVGSLLANLSFADGGFIKREVIKRDRNVEPATIYTTKGEVVEWRSTIKAIVATTIDRSLEARELVVTSHLPTKAAWMRQGKDTLCIFVMVTGEIFHEDGIGCVPL